MRGLSLLSDGELFAVNAKLVQKVVRNMTVTALPALPHAVAGITNLNGSVITMLSLSELLGRERSANTINAVVFKALTDGNDQMGLLIDKPGELVEIDESAILPPPLSAVEEDKYFIAGVAEIDGNLYRIIDIEAIMGHYKQGGKNDDE